MKSFKIGLIALLICLVLTACSVSSNKQQTQAKQPEADVIIKNANSRPFEEELISVFAQDHILYRVDIHHKKVKELTISIDQYRRGKYVDTILESSTTIDQTDREHPITLLFAREEIDAKHEKWLQAVFFKNGNLISATDPLPIRSENSLMGYGPVHLPLTLQIGEKKVIGSFAQTDQNGISVLNEIETKEAIQQATNYERAYLLKLGVK